MLMLDRRKLAAPLAAQAAAFVVVLVIGQFTSHTSAAAPAPGHTVPVSPGAIASTSAPTTKEASRKITVRVVDVGTGGLLGVADIQVNVLNQALTSVASGVLDQNLKYAVNVSAGQYQVCIEPPFGWASAPGGAHAFGDWVCAAADARTGPAAVTFQLVPQHPRVGL